MNIQRLVLLILLVASSAFASQPKFLFDEFGRVIHAPDKTKVNCPTQDKNTGVLLVIGQSNAANHAEKKFHTRYPTKVINYFNGQCYIASSPLLGATGNSGELITPLADELIENRDYKTIVLISSAIGGSAIAQWQKGAVLNTMLQSVIDQSPYQITEIIWHQGETDFMEKTSSKEYTQRFNSLVSSLRSNSTDTPPIYYAITSKCGQNPEWTRANPTMNAQRALANPMHNILLAVDTDVLLSDTDRAPDLCHFSETGQMKTAKAFADAIHAHKNLRVLPSVNR